MLRRLLKSWFGAAEKPPALPVSDALPDEVKTVIGASTVIDRGQGDEPDLVVIACAHGGFRFTHDAARAWLQTTFPELTEAQISRGMRFLASHVKERQERRAYDQVAASMRRTAWTDWKPLRHSER